MFSALNAGSRGMSAQRQRMNAIADNLANADTTRTDKGTPYRRRILQMTSRGVAVFTSAFRSARTALTATQPGHMATQPFPTSGATRLADNVEITETEDASPPRMVYDPSHPDANADGYVMMPNVNVVTEMVQMISASRAFEANAVAIGAVKAMAKDALEI